MMPQQGELRGASQEGKWLSRVFKSEKEGIFHEQRESASQRGISLCQGTEALCRVCQGRLAGEEMGLGARGHMQLAIVVENAEGLQLDVLGNAPKMGERVNLWGHVPRRGFCLCPPGHGL